jgi:hypothetical protein
MDPTSAENALTDAEWGITSNGGAISPSIPAFIMLALFIIGVISLIVAGRTIAGP